MNSNYCKTFYITKQPEQKESLEFSNHKVPFPALFFCFLIPFSFALAAAFSVNVSTFSFAQTYTVIIRCSGLDNYIYKRVSLQ